MSKEKELELEFITRDKLKQRLKDECAGTLSSILWRGAGREKVVETIMSCSNKEINKGLAGYGSIYRLKK